MRELLGIVAGVALTLTDRGATPTAQPQPPTVAAPLLEGLVSTKAGEVRIAISPDGRTMVWGAIGKAGRLSLLMATSSAKGWSKPQSLPFSSQYNDFDPAFAPDGRSFHFFSNRPGGLGGDDLYSVAFNQRSGRFGNVRNLGANVNTPGNEWAPALSPDGLKLLFATDGRGGKGGHDLFVSHRRRLGWSLPQPVTEVNTAADEFDATFLLGKNIIIFSRGNAERGPVYLHVARLSPPGKPWVVKLPPHINCSEFNIGPVLIPSQPTIFYWSSACRRGNGMDINWAPLKSLAL